MQAQLRLGEPERVGTHDGRVDQIGAQSIRAEVVDVEELERGGDMAALREQGKVRTEGRDYVIRDGDVVNFLFR